MGLNNPGMSSADLDAIQGYLHQSATAFDVLNRVQAPTAVAIADGVAHLTYFTPMRDLLVSAISYDCSAASTSQTLVRFGLFTAAANGDVVLVARTANDTAMLASNNTVYKKSLDTTGGFPATYTLRRGTRYAVGFLVVGGAPGSVRGNASHSVLAALAPITTMAKAGQADLADMTGLSVQTNVPWARLEV